MTGSVDVNQSSRRIQCLISVVRYFIGRRGSASCGRGGWWILHCLQQFTVQTSLWPDRRSDDNVAWCWQHHDGGQSPRRHTSWEDTSVLRGPNFLLLLWIPFNRIPSQFVGQRKLSSCLLWWKWEQAGGCTIPGVYHHLISLDRSCSKLSAAIQEVQVCTWFAATRRASHASSCFD